MSELDGRGRAGIVGLKGLLDEGESWVCRDPGWDLSKQEGEHGYRARLGWEMWEKYATFQIPTCKQ